VSIKSVEDETCQLFLYITRNSILKHPAMNVRLRVASVIVHLLPYCARMVVREKVPASLDYDEDDDTWKDNIRVLFGDGRRMEVSLNCLWCHFLMWMYTTSC